MIPVAIDYATPSAFESDRERALLGLAANARRPVRFHGRVRRELFPFRLVLQTLGELVWSNDSWIAEDEFRSAILDPVITVHPDRIFFEAFSQDQSAYGLVIADRELFETGGEVQCGTTNVDFTGWLWSALGEMRSSRETWLRIEPAGFEVTTTAAGGRFEAKVELPDDWVRGFLQLQGAMAMPGTRVVVRPVDLLAAVRFLRYTKAKVSPRALRYVFEPGRDAQVVLEPWEHTIRLKGAEHNYQEQRVIRTWGRRRLRLIEPLLPYAEHVEIYLKGRALPSFYAVKLPGLVFVLGLSGWTGHRWTGTGSFDLLDLESHGDAALEQQALQILRENYTASTKELGERLQIDLPAASSVLAALCRRGLAIFDVQRREYRHRELFETPIEVERLYPPDPRREAARQYVEQNEVHVQDCEVRRTVKSRTLKTPRGKIQRDVVYRDRHVTGTVGQHPSRTAEIVVNDSGRIIFGTCQCDFFQENLMNQGPCEHMLALFAASELDRAAESR